MDENPNPQQIPPENQTPPAPTPPAAGPTVSMGQFSAEQDVNAFNALSHDKLDDATASKLDTMNAPRKMAEFNSIKSMFGGLFVGAIFIGMGIFIDGKTHNSKAAFYLIAIGVVCALLFIVLSLIGFKQLHKSASSPQQFNQFQAGQAETYTNTNLPTATIADGETVKSWLGPCTVGGKAAVSFSLLNAQKDNQAINTLFFTDSQVIGVMFGPQDVPASLAGGTVNQVASAGINYSTEDAIAKNIQFEALYYQKWDQIVSAVLAQGMSQLTAQHLNFGIPYAQIAQVEFKEGAINPGMTFHFRDGNKRVFNTMRKDLLPGIQQFLSSKVQVS